ncbi:hypothetical protein BX661DRAFT_71743 [Kickxella alabastrina]|uniref:uncharacterized protein n=1 Tax=Kickxella alabastrina TaxID=61397 RepID=UPI00221F54C3|nr:uncharacterized protein BX661DRAFT_71743 [Kickxella alabastrina]KAI7833242.1 hypothetical protein BX661DRAFT_71743 [Kickxella alabastrina]
MRLAQSENDHFLDMISEMYPELQDGISSNSSDSNNRSSDSDINGNNNSGTESLADNNSDTSACSDTRPGKRRRQQHQRRQRPASASASFAQPLLTKRRRRQLSKRDDRNDPKPVVPVARDSSGNALMPMVLRDHHGQDEIRIHSLGQVNPADAYHTSRYIWPVGFRSTRMYPSMQDGQPTVYTSEILDGGDMPVFQVTAKDDEKCFRASSSSGVWKQVLDVLMAGGLGVKTHASGPQLFGLSHLAVTKAIQEMEGADMCRKYIRQRWIDDPNDSKTAVYAVEEETEDEPLAH